MKRLTEMFKTVEEAEVFAASLPDGSEQVGFQAGMHHRTVPHAVGQCALQ
jgi:hypothetical protein